MLPGDGSVKLQSMPRYIFIRHGESIANREGWLSGHTDVPLTESGELHASQTAVELREHRVTRAFSSDLVRASRTAELLLAETGLTAIQTPFLRERSCGRDQRNSLSVVQAEGRMTDYDTLDGHPPGGESLRTVAIRAMGFLAENELEDQCTLVVAHGALIRVVVGILDERNPAEFCAWKPGNCELIVRDVAVGNWSFLRGRLLDSTPTDS